MSRRPAGGRAPEGSVYIKAGLNTGYKRARSYGARWDKSTQGKFIAMEFWPGRTPRGCWFVPPGTSLDKFDEWEQTEPLFFDAAQAAAAAPAASKRAARKRPPPSTELAPRKKRKKVAKSRTSDYVWTIRHGLSATVVARLHTASSAVKICVSRPAGDGGWVSDFTGDALVNAADEKCIYGKSMDAAVNMGSGARPAPANKPLIRERKALPVLGYTRGRSGEEEIRCRTGDAVVTSGGLHQVRHIIHAVGPNYRTCSRATGDTQLKSAYRASLCRAEEIGASSVAFALLSASYFRGSVPLYDVLHTACSAIRDGVSAAAARGDLQLNEVHLVAYSQVEQDELLAAAEAVFGIDLTV